MLEPLALDLAAGVAGLDPQERGSRLLRRRVQGTRDPPRARHLAAGVLAVAAGAYKALVGGPTGGRASREDPR